MDEPWGVSDPKFLALYGAGLVVAMLWANLVHATLRRPSAGGNPRPLDVLELAHLSGGPRRVADTLLTRQFEIGTVRLGPGGWLRATGVPGSGDLDWKVLHGVPPPGRPARSLRDDLARDPSVRAIGERLVAWGLVVDPAAVGRVRAISALPLFALSGLGLLRWCAAMLNGRPSGVATVLLGVTVTAAAGLHRGRSRRLTLAGERIVDRARMLQRDGRLAVVAGPAMDPVLLCLSGVTGLVAVDGLVAHPDRTVATALADVARPRNRVATAFPRLPNRFLGWRRPGGTGASAAGNPGCGS
ncbi:hypothetical protein GCM10012275_28020 [Longimycelium tulufanense]|uniref:TIGR04222 domain-containing membrane protein n=1 Tax=Longimycelium tulufanense TaxID=907463 RepID=A0A8J3FUI2_9PSEU|nr:TIGR04222 domain-containing membrane protein [Longimycelium tulufanense]GGM55281.1 hypothetical protein GCM10012275_28020 [Longimycelium tulufanense]